MAITASKDSGFSALSRSKSSKSPGRSSQATDDIQQRFTSSLCEGHLAVVDMNSLPPLLVVCGLPGEEWDETISG